MYITQFLESFYSHPFIWGSKLQNFGDGAEVTSLVIGEDLTSADFHNAKGIWCNDGRVDVAVVDQIANDLKNKKALRLDKPWTKI